MTELTELQKAIRVLAKALKEDDGYYETWKSNISMSFQDEFYRSCLSCGTHEISNKAAISFLNKLCCESRDEQ